MVVRLRCQRFGRSHAPFYRIVVADARAPRDGKFIEIVGTYNPIVTKAGVKEIRLNVRRIKYWLTQGVQPSERVAWLLGQFNILPELPQRWQTINNVPKKLRREQAAAASKGFHTLPANRQVHAQWTPAQAQAMPPAPPCSPLSSPSPSPPSSQFLPLPPSIAICPYLSTLAMCSGGGSSIFPAFSSSPLRTSVASSAASAALRGR